MNTYDLIGFDMDGTLLDSRKSILPSTVEAIGRAVAAGKTVILSTGRSINELEEFAGQLAQVRYYVCESGALIYDSKERKILHSETLAQDVVMRILDVASAEDTMPYIISNGESFADRRHIADLAHFHMGIYQDMMDRVVCQMDDMIAQYRKNPFPMEKLNLFSASEEIRERIYENVKSLPLAFAYAEETSLEMTPLHISKASGLRWLCGYLGIPLERTVIVGDADNDAEAMEAAGLSVAMGNALPHIKEMCGAVVSDNDSGGCAEAVDRYLLGKA